MSLEALERSDLSRLPGGIFTRSFIRAYAQEVGLDPDRTIQEFIAELPTETAAATAHPVAIEDGEQLESDRKTVATAAKLVAISLPIAAALIYMGLQRAAPPADVAAASAEVAEPVQNVAPVEVDESAEVPTVTPPPPALPSAAGLVMVIAPKADCWVSATADGERVLSGLMRAGERREIGARGEISLNVGDAGAFTYTLNGKPGRPLGAPGEVVSRRITLADVADYVAR